MRKTTFTVVAASSLILTAIAGWTTGSSRSVQANASTEIAAQIDTFSMMASQRVCPVRSFRTSRSCFRRRVRKVAAQCPHRNQQMD